MTLSFLSTMLLTEISVLGNLEWEGAYFKILEDPISKEALPTALKRYTSFQITTHFLLTKIIES